MLTELHVPHDLVHIIRNMYIDSKGVLQPGTADTAAIDFTTLKVVKQGDGASPELFSLYFDRVYGFIEQHMGRNSYTRSQCREYSIACISIFMLAFADDIVLIAPGVPQLQKLLSVFALFCRNNDLVINTKKTEVMLTRCTGALYVNKVQLQECQVFKYLGIEIKSTVRSTTHILYTRLKHAKVALLRIKNNAQMLGLNNCRVRLQMATALVVSVLLYGAPIFACLSDRGMTFQPSTAAFKAAEEFIRECLRWALRVRGDVRSSLLHVVGNSESV